MVPLREVVREWGRIGLVGFGGPPAHVALLRELCVDRRRWMEPREFEDANAACGLLPGPASTQLAIFCAHRVGGGAGAVAGGLAFIVPGLVAVIALAALTLQDAPPRWIGGLAAGAGAAAVAVVAQAGIGLARTSVGAPGGAPVARAVAYLVAGAAAALTAGAWVVLALLGTGLVELTLRRRGEAALSAWPLALPLAAAAARGASELPALAWTALKVGALSYGGGFVIVPLMQGDAVDVHGWTTQGEFLNAVAIGQLTPGPIVQTVAAVGWAAAGLPGAVLAAAVAFAPSFLIILLAGERFERLRGDRGARAFLDGAGPAAVGAILGAALALVGGVQTGWQWAVLALAAALLLSRRAGVVAVLLAAAGAGMLLGLAGAPLP
jgi:chromate transporter